MSNYQTIKAQAQQFRQAKNYSAALPLYKDLWTNYRNQCNEWEGWGYAFCLKHAKQYAEALEISREVYKLNPNFDNIRSVYAWCIYYTEIAIEKVNDEQKYLKAAEGILKLTKQNDQYSPFTLTAIKILEYLNDKAIYPFEKILEWTDKLNPDLLDEQPFSFTDNEGKTRELASKKEQYYMWRTKALYEKGLFNDCIHSCHIALETFPKFHYDNDIWFRRLIALSHNKLGNSSLALNDLKEILKRKNEWFIQKEIAEICLKQNAIDEALKFAVDAALNFGDADKKLNLFKVLTEILKTKGKSEEAKKHVEFIYQIKKANQFKIDTDLLSLLHEYQIDQNKTVDVKELSRQMKQLWEALKFGNQEQLKGFIKSVLPNGKAGFIETDNKMSYYFQLKEFKGRKELAVQGQKVSFFLQDGFDTKKNQPTRNAVNVKPIR